MGIITIENKRKNIKIEFGIKSIPHRKNKALIKMRGAQIEILGYFNNDKSAEEFDKILNLIVDVYKS